MMTALPGTDVCVQRLTKLKSIFFFLVTGWFPVLVGYSMWNSKNWMKQIGIACGLYRQLRTVAMIESSAPGMLCTASTGLMLPLCAIQTLHDPVTTLPRR